MYTRRIPNRDDRWIYRLILEELVPFSMSAAQDKAPTYKEIRKRLNHGVTYIIRSYGRMGKGFIHLHKVKSSYWIDMLAISRRDQGNGYGSALIKLAIRQCRRRGFSSLHVFVDRINPRAIAFYIKHGFEMEGYEKSIDCYRMGRQSGLKKRE
jgi:ribosomal protein S18 acetylase RimI-like enzyme